MASGEHPGGLRCGKEAGQSTVEFALVLPVVVFVALIVVQAVVVGRDVLLVHHAAREAARAGAVDANGSSARRAAQGATSLDPTRLTVTWQGSEPGEHGKARVSYRVRTIVPLVGALVGDIELHSEVTARIE